MMLNNCRVPLKPSLCSALIIVCALPGLPSRAQQDPATQALAGIATTRDGRPVANATLLLMPPPGIRTDGGRPTEAVTDAGGGFVWNVPGHLRFNASSAPPSCWAPAPDVGVWRFPQPPGWRAVMRDPRFWPASVAFRPCETHWQGAGPESGIAVIVPEMGTVALAVRGPDGAPLRNHAVQVISRNMQFDDTGTPITDGRTDGEGRLSLPYSPGAAWLQLLAPGVGFGSTGTFMVTEDRTVTPAIPPLAPLARISGSVAPSLRTPNASVISGPGSDYRNRWYNRSAPVDADGRWEIGDILPGNYYIHISSEPGAGESVRIRPGDNITGVVLTPRRPYTPPARPASAQPEVTNAMEIRGVVRDTHGRPVAGATVYAADPGAGLRTYGLQVSANTDGAGRYTTPDLHGIAGSSIMLVATHRGFAPAQMIVSRLGTATEPGHDPDVRADLVLSAATSRLAVRVLSQGKPVAGASVRLTPEGWTALFPEGYALQGPHQDTNRPAVLDLLAPTAMTNRDGKALFTDLAPGLWDATAAAHLDPQALDRTVQRRDGHGGENAFGFARGIAVRAGQEEKFSLSIYPQPGAVSCRILGPDGRPPDREAVHLTADPGTAEYPWYASIKPDWAPETNSLPAITLNKDGIGAIALPIAGLWRVGVELRDPAGQASSITPKLDRDEGEALFAVSPALAGAAPVTIHTAPVGSGPGRLRVHLEDAGGRPARGAVMIARGGREYGLNAQDDPAAYCASLDSHGEAVFQDMLPGVYEVTVNPIGLPGPPSLGSTEDPLPADADLPGVVVLDTQVVSVEPNTETPVTFTAQPVGYIRGRLAVPPDQVGNCHIYCPPPPRGSWMGFFPDSETRVRLDSRTGEFVAGPFIPGLETLEVDTGRAALGASNSLGRPTIRRIRVRVQPGQVVRVTVIPDQEKPLSLGSDYPSLRANGMPPAAPPLPLLGTVFLPDGVTPAAGARVALVGPGSHWPIDMARVDATGHLVRGDYWYTVIGALDRPTMNDYSASAPTPEPDRVTPPSLVAWLPGSHGASVVAYVPGQEARIVLPAPASLYGEVTVGGKPVANLNASFRVVATYQGSDNLTPLLSVEATAQADGSFVLAGLTPGTYKVQAARDSIWLSETRTVVVGSKESAPLTLDIPKPGQAVDLDLVDLAGRPLPRTDVVISHPDGPLTDAVWPRGLHTDSRGHLYLEGLPAGQEKITVFAMRLEVPAASDDHPDSPFATIVLDVPPFSPGTEPIQRTMRVGSPINR